MLFQKSKLLSLLLAITIVIGGLFVFRLNDDKREVASHSKLNPIVNLSFEKNLSDKSGNANHGEPKGEIAFVEKGVLGEALRLDGVDDYVEIADASYLDINSPISLAAWVKFDTTFNSSSDDVYVIFGKGDGSYANSSYLFGFDARSALSSEGWLFFVKSDGLASGGNNICVSENWDCVKSTNTSWEAGEWYHVATTWDGSLDANTMKVYVNGILGGSATAAKIDGNNVATPLEIPWSNTSFPGMIDEAYLWNREISASEVEALYNQRCVSPPIDSPDIYGQAYSPNIGWINFYCENGDTDPDTTGLQALSDFCEVANPYKVSFDSATDTFSGYAYSSNYGWLDLNGITLTTANDMDGSTDYGNFGATDFTETGVSLNTCSHRFSGFAYSEDVGWISFATPTDPGLQALYGSTDYGVKTTGMETATVFGQAYSENIGWINFYCDGAGNARPEDATVGPETMPNFCNDIAYGVTYDGYTQTLSGVAYSNNYGWLDLNGVTIDGDNKLVGSTSGAGLGDYYFGNTYFSENQPSAENPGVRYREDDGYLCGFAYSDTVGYISFCDPETKDGIVGGIVGYDWDTYAVYMGSSADGNPPTITTPNQYLTATESYEVEIYFQDESNIDEESTVEVKVENAQGETKIYNTPDFDPATNRAKITISNHDFSSAPNSYNLTYSVCDVNGNCVTDEILTNFFNVNTGTPHEIEPDSTTAVVADGDNELEMKFKLIDTSGNAIIPDSAKDVRIQLVYDNTVYLDQITSTGDSAITEVYNPTTPIPIGSDQTSDWFDATDGEGYFIWKLTSYAPTKAGFSPIINDFNLSIKQINYEITWKGEFADLPPIPASSISLSATPQLAKFEPAFLAEPKALIFNGSEFVVTGESKYNITINTAKRIRIDLKNQSDNNGINNINFGLAAHLKNTEDVFSATTNWDDINIEKIDATPTNIDITSSLDTDSNTTYNQNLSDVDGVINYCAAGATKEIFMRLKPSLNLGESAPEKLKPIVETFVSYEIDGKTIKHKGGMLDVAARVYNPSIAISGSIKGETDSKQEEAISESYGDLSRNELKTDIDRNVSAFTSNSAVTYCSTSPMLITGKNAGNFVTTNINSDCLYRDDTIIYTKGDVYLDLSGDVLPSGIHTLLITEGNLHIQSNMGYQNARDSFGVIVLKGEGNKNRDDVGNIYIYPEKIDGSAITNIVGAYYAEGGIMSVNKNGIVKEDLTNDCNINNDGFCDRAYELRHQLYFKGVLATANTVGGSDRISPVFPSALSNTLVTSYQGDSDDGRSKARLYDLTYLRTFHKLDDGSPTPNYSGNHATGITDDDAVVFRYDSRITTNPPPLFSGSGVTSSGAVGY